MSLLPSSKQQQHYLESADSPPAKRTRLAVIDAEAAPLGDSRSLGAQQRPSYSGYLLPSMPPLPPGEPQISADTWSTPVPSERARLTRKNLRRLNRMSDSVLANGSKPPSVLSLKTKMTREESNSTATSISTSSSDFAALALENGILPSEKSKVPTNLEDLCGHLNRDRGSPTPSESAYEDYVIAVEAAPNEQTMLLEMAHLLKKHDDRGYRKVLNQAFTGFPKDVGFNNYMSAPRPHLIEGLRYREFHPFPIEQQTLLTKSVANSVVLPHLAAEWRAPGKKLATAWLQGAYDGASLVYARNRALHYVGAPDPPGHAAVSTFNTDGTNIYFFSHYAAPSSRLDGKPEYHQFLTAFTNLTSSFEGFKQGRKQLRNLQEHARAESYALRDKLKDHWTTRTSAPGIQSAAYHGGDLNRVQEQARPVPTLEGDPYTGDADGYARPSRAAKRTRHRRRNRSRNVSPVDLRSLRNNIGFGIVDGPTHASTPPQSPNLSGHQQNV